MKAKHIRAYMDTAKRFAECSTAERLKVGAILVKHDQILSVGYNGTPAGWDNVCEDREWCSAGGWLDLEEIEERWPYEGTYIDSGGNEMQGRYRLVTKPIVLHAEKNCLAKMARSTSSAEGSTLFVTHGPCLPCSLLIYQSGVSEVYYEEDYRSEEGVYFLRKAGVKITKL